MLADAGKLQGIAHGCGQPRVPVPQLMGHHSSPCAEFLVGQLLVASVGPGNCGPVGERRAQRRLQHFCMPKDPCGEAAQAEKCAQQDTFTVISFGFRTPLLVSTHRTFSGVVVTLSDKAFLSRGQALGPAAKGPVPDGRSAR